MGIDVKLYEKEELLKYIFSSSPKSKTKAPPSVISYT